MPNIVEVYLDWTTVKALSLWNGVSNDAPPSNWFQPAFDTSPYAPAVPIEPDPLNSAWDVFIGAPPDSWSDPIWSQAPRQADNEQIVFWWDAFVPEGTLIGTDNDDVVSFILGGTTRTSGQILFPTIVFNGQALNAIAKSEVIVGGFNRVAVWVNFNNFSVDPTAASMWYSVALRIPYLAENEDPSFYYMSYVDSVPFLANDVSRNYESLAPQETNVHFTTVNQQLLTSGTPEPPPSSSFQYFFEGTYPDNTVSTMWSVNGIKLSPSSTTFRWIYEASYNGGVDWFTIYVSIEFVSFVWDSYGNYQGSYTFAAGQRPSHWRIGGQAAPFGFGFTLSMAGSTMNANIQLSSDSGQRQIGMVAATVGASSGQPTSAIHVATKPILSMGSGDWSFSPGQIIQDGTPSFVAENTANVEDDRVTITTHHRLSGEAGFFNYYLTEWHAGYGPGQVAVLTKDIPWPSALVPDARAGFGQTRHGGASRVAYVNGAFNNAAAQRVKIITMESGGFSNDTFILGSGFREGLLAVGQATEPRFGTSSAICALVWQLDTGNLPPFVGQTVATDHAPLWKYTETPGGGSNLEQIGWAYRPTSVAQIVPMASVTLPGGDSSSDNAIVYMFQQFTWPARSDPVFSVEQAWSIHVVVGHDIVAVHEPIYTVNPGSNWIGPDANNLSQGIMGLIGSRDGSGRFWVTNRYFREPYFNAGISDGVQLAIPFRIEGSGPYSLVEEISFQFNRSFRLSGLTTNRVVGRWLPSVQAYGIFYLMTEDSGGKTRFIFDWFDPLGTGVFTGGGGGRSYASIIG